MLNTPGDETMPRSTTRILLALLVRRPPNAPIMTAGWVAALRNKWTVPFLFPQ
jgi:hypothetical protein